MIFKNKTLSKKILKWSLSAGIALALLTSIVYKLRSAREEQLFLSSLKRMQADIISRQHIQYRRSLADVGERPACYLDRFKTNYIERELRMMEASYESNETLAPEEVFLDLPEEDLKRIEAIYGRALKVRRTPQGAFAILLLRSLPLSIKQKISGACEFEKEPECLVSEARALAETSESQADRKILSQMTYYWFLKTKTLLGGVEDPEFKDLFKPADVFFTKYEMIELFRALLMVPHAFFRAPVFSLIFRIPNSEAYLNKNPNDRNLLGLAFHENWYSESPIKKRDGSLTNQYVKSAKGFIKLYERTLQEIRLKKQRNEPGSFLDATFIHELAHQIDVNDGQSDAQFLVRFSMTPKWLDLSGWQLVSYHDDDTWDLLWRIDDQLEEKSARAFEKLFVSDYARTNPVEDFAETVSFFVTSPEGLAKKTPMKTSLVSQEIFRGTHYAEGDLRRRYLAQSLLSAASVAHQLEQRCESETPGQCKLSRFQRLWNYIASEIKVADPMGCDYFEWDQEGRLEAEFKRAVSNWPDSIFSIEFEETQKKFGSLIDARSVYFKCVKEMEEKPWNIKDSEKLKECYDQQLTSSLSTALGHFSGGDAEALTAIKSGLAESLNFVQANQLALKWFEEYLKPILFKSSDAAARVYRSCLKSDLKPQKSLSKKPVYYTGGEDYIVPEVLDCLNSGINVQLSELVDDYSAQQNLSSKTLRMWVIDRLARYAVGTFDFYSVGSRQEEIGVFENWIFKILDARKYQPGQFDKCFRETEKVARKEYSKKLQQTRFKFIDPESSIYQYVYDSCSEKTKET